MTEKMMDRSCTDFAAVLAAKESVPGGGGAAAYVGALGVALCSMVGNFTTGKKKYAEYEQDVQRMLAEGEKIRTRLLELVEEDAAAFYPLSQAYGIPKEDPTRDEQLEKCTKDALAGPLEMMRQIAKSIELLEEMNVKGSRMLISDVGCGAVCAAAEAGRFAAVVDPPATPTSTVSWRMTPESVSILFFFFSSAFFSICSTVFCSFSTPVSSAPIRSFAFATV